MPRVRCRVCDGYGAIGQDDRTCPECKGKGYLYEPQWVIDKEREENRDREKGEKYIVLRERKHKVRLKHELPPFTCAFLAVLLVLGVLAWVFRLSFPDWPLRMPSLKWLSTIPFAIAFLFFLPDIIRWARKKSEHR